MNDKIDAVIITHKTYDLIVVDYASAIDELVSESWIRRFERGLLDSFLLMTKLTKSDVLDIGCGDGRDTEHLRQKRAVVVAVDYSRSMLIEVRKRIKEGVLCQMDMRNLGFSSDSFDGVWTNGCIYHVPKTDLGKVLREVLRVLRPLGIFSFNLKIGIGEQLEEAPRSYKRGPRFYAYYRRREMKDYLEQAGFEFLGIRKYPQKILGEEIIHLWCRKPIVV
tara:strand:- start:235 stop:897 length:663 start_codon:yes stop_codon:yes gene_type:complete